MDEALFYKYLYIKISILEDFKTKESQKILKKCKIVNFPRPWCIVALDRDEIHSLLLPGE